MSTDFILLGFALFFIVALLYSSIGHAGASGYLAIMALLSFQTESIKPTSLLLNILVSAIASYRFLREGYFDKKIFFAFILFSLPFAYWGGYLKPNPLYFKIMAGVFLIISSVMMLLRLRKKEEQSVKGVKNLWLWASLLGSLIGFISGIIGVGGGIFLTPLILMLGWTSIRNASGVSAVFILCNSISGLMGHMNSLQKVDLNISFWAVAVILGGIAGSYLGSRKFNNTSILICLFIVLLSAGLKFIFVDTMK
jgi:hypothetical protein